MRQEAWLILATCRHELPSARLELAFVFALQIGKLRKIEGIKAFKRAFADIMATVEV